VVVGGGKGQKSLKREAQRKDPCEIPVSLVTDCQVKKGGGEGPSKTAKVGKKTTEGEKKTSGFRNSGKNPKRYRALTENKGPPDAEEKGGDRERWDEQLCAGIDGTKWVCKAFKNMLCCTWAGKKKAKEESL